MTEVKDSNSRRRYSEFGDQCPFVFLYVKETVVVDGYGWIISEDQLLMEDH